MRVSSQERVRGRKIKRENNQYNNNNNNNSGNNLDERAYVWQAYPLNHSKPQGIIVLIWNIGSCVWTLSLQLVSLIWKSRWTFKVGNSLEKTLIGGQPWGHITFSLFLSTLCLLWCNVTTKHSLLLLPCLPGHDRLSIFSNYKLKYTLASLGCLCQVFLTAMRGVTNEKASDTETWRYYFTTSLWMVEFNKVPCSQKEE